MARVCNPVITGFLDFLEKRPNIVDIKVHVGRPSNQAQLTSWEECNGCRLPEDLKLFYVTNDGLELQWSYNTGESSLCLGRINICCLALLKPFRRQPPTSTAYPSLLDLDCVSVSTDHPLFSECCRIFSLDFCPSSGHICLVFTEQGHLGSHSIWLLDLSHSWHYLCSSFSDYVRIAIAHLGLRQWPYALTSNGLNPQYEKWFHQFIPKRLELDYSAAAAGSIQPSGHGSGDITLVSTNFIDTTKLISSRDRRSRHASSSTKKQAGNR